MEQDESGQLLLKLLALAERMERRDERVIALLAAQGAALQSAAREVEGAGQRFLRDVLDTLRGQGRDAVQAGVGEAVAQCRERLWQASAEAARGAETLRTSADTLRQQRTLWLWAAPLALLVGSVLAAAAAAYAVMTSRAEVARHRIEAALLRAYNRADVILCGERLCVNVDEQGARYGQHRQYRPVESRKPSP